MEYINHPEKMWDLLVEGATRAGRLEELVKRQQEMAKKDRDGNVGVAKRWAAVGVPLQLIHFETAKALWREFSMQFLPEMLSALTAS